MVGCPLAFRLQQTHPAQQIVFTPPTTANDHRQAFELRVAQQLHRRIKRVHVQVGNAAGKRGHGA